MEEDELNDAITELFNKWVTDIESVEIPVLVTDEEALRIITSAMKREGVVKKLLKKLFS